MVVTPRGGGHMKVTPIIPARSGGFLRFEANFEVQNLGGQKNHLRNYDFQALTDAQNRGFVMSSEQRKSGEKIFLFSCQFNPKGKSIDDPNI